MLSGVHDRDHPIQHEIDDGGPRHSVDPEIPVFRMMPVCGLEKADIIVREDETVGDVCQDKHGSPVITRPDSRFWIGIYRKWPWKLAFHHWDI